MSHVPEDVMLHLLLQRPLRQYTMAEIAGWPVEQIQASTLLTRRAWKRMQRRARASGLAIWAMSQGRRGGLFQLGNGR
jgi:hypothetical protein